MSEPDPSPDERILRLNAALDGELDAANWLELERAMRADPALAAQYRMLGSTRDAIRRHVPREAAPRALADRIAALARPPAAVRRPPWNSARALARAASIAAVSFAAGVGLMSLRTPSGANDVAASLVSDFARAEIAGQPFDIASSDRHTVKPWLAARATVSAEIADLGQEGFALEGGRIAIVDRVPAPTLVYRRREHLIAVTELPLSVAGGRGGAMETIDGFHVARWSDANLSYVAVSDVDEKDLAAFVAAFKQARMPAVEAPRR
jgi:anti-sigma factor RsiW